MFLAAHAAPIFLDRRRAPAHTMTSAHSSMYCITLFRGKTPLGTICALKPTTLSNRGRTLLTFWPASCTLTRFPLFLMRPLIFKSNYDGTVLKQSADRAIIQAEISSYAPYAGFHTSYIEASPSSCLRTIHTC